MTFGPFVHMHAIPYIPLLAAVAVVSCWARRDQLQIQRIITITIRSYKTPHFDSNDEMLHQCHTIYSFISYTMQHAHCTISLHVVSHVFWFQISHTKMYRMIIVRFCMLGAQHIDGDDCKPQYHRCTRHHDTRSQCDVNGKSTRDIYFISKWRERKKSKTYGAFRVHSLHSCRLYILNTQYCLSASCSAFTICYNLMPQCLTIKIYINRYILCQLRYACIYSYVSTDDCWRHAERIALPCRLYTIAANSLNNNESNIAAWQECCVCVA